MVGVSATLANYPPFNSFRFKTLRSVAVQDGQYSATWSPLARDDASFTQHLARKARKETFSIAKRLEDFSQQNLLIFGGYLGAYMMGSAN